MASIGVTKVTGKTSGKVELDDALFSIDPNIPVMHQVVTAQLAARRAGTQSTKTRAEVAGGGAKPWRQKGTGRSRQGSIRSPQWRGGGVALGPKPRSYRQRTPKKMVRLALASALSDRRADGRVLVLDSWGIDTPSTKRAIEILGAVGAEGRVLVVLSPDDEAVWKSLRNLPEVHVLTAGQLNAYDVLVSDWVVFTKASLPGARPDTPADAAGGRSRAARKTRTEAAATADEAPTDDSDADADPDAEATEAEER